MVNSTKDARREFARVLQTAMIDRGMNQAELAEKCKLMAPKIRFERDTISSYIRAIALPSPKRMAVIAKALGVDVSDITPKGYREPAFEAERTPRRDMKDEGDGNVWIDVSQSVPYETALEILRLLKAPR